MVAIGASGVLGIAREAVEGEYTAPEKWTPIRSESLNWQQDNVYRRVIKGVADLVGTAQGNARVEGDIDMEVYTDVLAYFLYAARGTVTKTDLGAGAGPFEYAFKPSHAATPDNTLSFHVEKADQVFGFLGCVVGNMEFSVDNGLLVCTMSIMGRDEANQAVLSPSYDENDPIGAGNYDIRIPAGAANPDLTIDSFTLNMENNPDPQYRLNPTSPGARYIAYGEREVTLSVERDFESRAELQEFKDLTSKAISIECELDSNNIVRFDMRSAIVDSYEVGLSGQGDLVRASITYQGEYSSTDTESLGITVTTDEDIV